MMPRLRDGRRLAQFKAEQRDKRRRLASTSEAASRDDDSPVHSAFWSGLAWEEARQAKRLLSRCNQRRRLRGARYAGRIAAIRGVVLRGLVGDSVWGWRMHGKRGGQNLARHALHHLRAISSAGACASVIARGPPPSLTHRLNGLRPHGYWLSLLIDAY
jgi:hypothetical protein